MTRPIAAATPPSVIRSKPSPAAFIAKNVISTVTGITAVATSVMRQSRRNTHKISTDSNSPTPIASRTLAIADFTSSDSS